MFGRLGACIIDTDEISHELTGPHGLAIQRIAEVFGAEYISNGCLDRAKMRRLVFSDPSSKARLEAILHPMILQVVDDRIASCKAPYYLLVVPLLFETEHYRERADRTLVVDCSEALQVMRAMERSHLSEAEVRVIMDNQVKRSVRLARADDILDNNGEIATLESGVLMLHRKYLPEQLKNQF